MNNVYAVNDDIFYGESSEVERFVVTSNGEIDNNSPSGYSGSLLSLNNNGTSELNIDQNGHFVTQGASPTIAAGTGTGTDAIYNLSSGTTGIAQIFTGTGASANNPLATITFAHTFSINHVVMVQEAAFLYTCNPYVVVTSTSTFTIDCQQTPTVSTTFYFEYIAIQY